MDDFLAVFEDDRIFEVRAAIEQLLDLFNSDSDLGVPIDVQTQLFENYPSRSGSIGYYAASSAQRIRGAESRLRRR